MRQYMQQRVREKLADDVQAVRRAYECLAPKAWPNDSVVPLPDSVSDCAVAGTVIIGRNSRMHSCVVGENVDLEIGDNCIIYGSVFISERDWLEARRLRCSGKGVRTHVKIADGCIIAGSYINGTVEIGADSLILCSSIRRSLHNETNEESCKATCIRIGRQAVLYKAGIHANEIPSDSPDYSDMVFGDDLVMLMRCFSIAACRDVVVGNRALFCDYTGILQQLDRDDCLLPSDIHCIADCTEDGDLSLYVCVAKYMLQFYRLGKVRIGDGAYIAASICMTSDTEAPGSFVLGEDNIIVDNTRPSRDDRCGSDYSSVVTNWEAGKSCTFVVSYSHYSRSSVNTPVSVKIRDGVNIVLIWNYETCPISELEITADGCYNI